MSFLTEIADALFVLMDKEIIENTARYIPENNTCILQFAKDLTFTVPKGSTAVVSIEDVTENGFVQSNMMVFSVCGSEKSNYGLTFEGKTIAAKYWAEGGPSWTALQRALIKANSNDDRANLVVHLEIIPSSDDFSSPSFSSFHEIPFK
jgi:hypothetical protein